MSRFENWERALISHAEELAAKDAEIAKLKATIDRNVQRIIALAVPTTDEERRIMAGAPAKSPSDRPLSRMAAGIARDLAKLNS